MAHRSTALIAAAAGFALAAGSAHATLFSFASDVNQQAPTFLGTAGSGTTFNITDSGPSNTFNLLIDDNNGPAPAFSANVRFQCSLTASWISSPVLFGTTVQHIYSVFGSFSFIDTMSGSTLLSATVAQSAPGVFSVPGTATTWSTTGAVLASDSFANVSYTATAALVNKMTGAGFNPTIYGIADGASLGPDDFGFDLSVLFQRGSTTGVSLNPTTRLPTQGWQSEGSYSGSSVDGFVPAPGAAALLGIAGLVAGRRRRA